MGHHRAVRVADQPLRVPAGRHGHLHQGPNRSELGLIHIAESLIDGLEIATDDRPLVGQGGWAWYILGCWRGGELGELIISILFIG